MALTSPGAVVLRVKRKRTDEHVPDAIVVQGLQLNNNRLDERLCTLTLDQAAQQPEKKLRFSRVADVVPMQAMLHDAGLHAPSTHIDAHTPGYVFAGGHAHADCVVYDLVAGQGAPAVDARLLQMTLQYLQETGQAGDDVATDLQHSQETVKEEAAWEYDYYTLQDDDLDDSSVDVGSASYVLVPDGDRWVVSTVEDDVEEVDDEDDPDAEGHYANSYPDEDDWATSSTGDSLEGARRTGWQPSEEEFGGHLSEESSDW